MMLIRLVEVVEVRELDTIMDGGYHRHSKLESAVSLGRQVRLEIDQPLNDALHFEPREEMILILVPSKSLLVDIARKLADPELYLG